MLAVEDTFETAKNGLGLDQDETRFWHGWRLPHVSLVVLALAMLARVRPHANTAPHRRNTAAAAVGALAPIHWSIQEVQRVVRGRPSVPPHNAAPD